MSTYGSQSAMSNSMLWLSKPSQHRVLIEKKVVHISKLTEGSFNRIFLLTMDDGFEVIAKIPFPLTVPKRLTTESEVATLD